MTPRTCFLLSIVLVASPAWAKTPKQKSKNPVGNAPSPMATQTPAQPTTEAAPAPASGKATAAPAAADTATPAVVGRSSMDGEMLSLSAAYGEALRYSPAIQVAAQNVELADRTLRGTWSLIGPSINVNLQGNLQPGLTQSYPDGSIIPTQKPATVSGFASITQPLVRAALFPSRDAARNGLSAAQQLLKRAREQLSYDVATAFVGVMRARQLVLLGKSIVARAEAQLASTRNRVKLGAALKTAELLASLDVARANVQLTTSMGELETQEAIFQRLVGRAPPQGLALPPTPGIDRLEELVEGVAHRGDVRSLEFARSQALMQEKTLRRQILWPTLDVRAQLIGGYPTFNTFADVYLRYVQWNAGVVLNIPIFNGGTEWVQARLQHVRADIVYGQQRVALIQAGEDVRRAIAKLTQFRRTLDLAVGQLEVAQQNYDLVSTQFKLGAVLFLEVANAQRALSEAETQRLVAGFDTELATYQLLFAAGKLQL